MVLVRYTYYLQSPCKNVVNHHDEVSQTNHCSDNSMKLHHARWVEQNIKGLHGCQASAKLRTATKWRRHINASAPLMDSMVSKHTTQLLVHHKHKLALMECTKSISMLVCRYMS